MTTATPITAAQAIVNYKANHGIAKQSIADTSADVAGLLDQLQALAAAGDIASIALTSTAPMQLNATSFQADTGVLTLITGAYGVVVTGALAASAAGLQASPHVTGFTVADTASNVLQNLSVLNAATKLTSLTITNPSAIALAYTQYAAGVLAFAKLTAIGLFSISGAPASAAASLQTSAAVHAFSVTDTAANISANFSSLSVSTKLQLIVLGDNGTLLIGLAQMAAGSMVLAKLPASYSLSVSGVTVAAASLIQANSHVTSFSITDTGANLLAALDGLNGYSKLTAISESGGAPLALTAARYVNDAAILARFTGPWTASVTGLGAAAAAGAQANLHITSFSVSDSAQAIAGNFDGLNADNKISGVSIAGGGALSLTGAQIFRDTAALGWLPAACPVIATAAEVNMLPVLQANAHVTSIQVTDTAANLIAGLSTLTSMTKVSAISVSGGTTLTVSYAQLQSYGGVLARLASPDLLAVTGVTAAQAPSVQANTHVSLFSVTDTAANIASGLTALNGDGKLTAINVTGSGVISLNYAAFMGGQTALSHIAGNYTLNVSGAAAAGATLTAANSHVTSFTVGDTLGDIGAQMTQLAAVVKTGKLTAINVTDTGQSLTLSAAQYAADSGVIALMHGAFTINTPPPTHAAINLVWDSQALAAPAAFRSAVTYAAQYLQSLITNPITINISVGYGEIQGSTLGAGVLGAAGPVQGVGLSYTQYRNELALQTGSPNVQAIANAMSATDPTRGDPIYVASAQEKALGMMSGTASGLDGAMGFAADPNGTLFTYDPNNRAAIGKYDFIGVVEHELTHALGRIAIGGQSGNWVSALDLFRFSAPGTHNLIAGTNAYFSVNNGATNLDTFSNYSDPGDWASGAGNDANGAFANPGVVNQFSSADITELGALGYAASGTPSAALITAASVTAISGLNAPSLSFTGAPTIAFMSADLPVITANLGGVEEICQFAYGVNELQIDLRGAANSTLLAFDTSIGGQHAIALASSADMTHGIVLMGMRANDTAADLMAHHLTSNGGMAIVA